MPAPERHRAALTITTIAATFALGCLTPPALPVGAELSARDTVILLPDARTTQINSLTLSLQVADTTARGIPVPFAILIRNGGQQAAKGAFRRDGPVNFMVIAPSGRVIWSLLAPFPRVYSQVAMADAIPPGQTREFHGAWDQRDSTGALVPPGRYLARASLHMTYAGTRLDSIAVRQVPFEIR